MPKETFGSFSTWNTKEAGAIVVVVILLAVGQVAFAETKSLETQTVHCIPGKGPTSSELPEKCWSGASAGGNVSAIAEDGKNKNTDNLVEVGLDGKMKMCSKPIPLDINCKPKWTGTVTYCDGLSGRRECRTLSKGEPAGENMGKTLGDFAKNSLNPDLQKEISARTMEAVTRQMIKDVGVTGGTFNDPYCVLVACNLDEEAPPLGGARMVSLTKEDATRLANSPDLGASVQEWVEASRDAGMPAQLPITPTWNAQYLSPDHLSRSYMMETGTQVQVYSWYPEVIGESAMPNYYGTGANLPTPSGDSTFQSPTAPSIPLAPANTWGGYFESIRLPSWMTSATQKVRGWFGI